MIRYFSLFAIFLWCVGDPIRDLFWGHPAFHPGTRWDWWHICKTIHVYPPLIALLWWMWPPWERKYWNFFGYLDGGVVYLHVMYWAIAGLLSQGIWRLVIYLAGGW